MSGFDLEPVDGDELVHVPPGETVVGRGPFLQVWDRRVSRHHGVLENLDGRLRLKPTHLNPCFIQSTLCDDPQPLQKDEWHTLRHGDFFSLLPGFLIFKVKAVNEAPPTPRNKQMFEKQQEKEQAPPACVGERKQTPPPASQTSEEVLSAPSISPKQGDSPERGAQEEKKEVNVTPTEPRKRVLPAWMMAARTAASKKPVVSPKGQKQKATTSPSSKKPAQATPTKTSTSPEDAQRSSEEKPRKRRWNNKEEPDQTKSNTPSRRPATRSQGEDDSASVPAGSVPTPGPSTSTVQTRQTAKANQNNPSVSSATAATTRTPCQYGKDCYRKNPLHFQECSHPGDADYQEKKEEEEEEEEEAEERPECPFGTDCYRKNPLHRKEYKHTKRPGAPRTRTAARRNYRDDEEDDEDSFIDDEGVDAGSDSDYVPPPDSDEGPQEETRRLRREVHNLQEEAKKFLYRKK